MDTILITPINPNTSHQRFTIPGDCQVSQWNDWSNCSVRCGNGTKTRARKVVRESKNGGATCPDLKETDVCKTDDCKGIFFLCIYVTLFSTLQGETDDTTFTTTFLILTIAGSVLLLTFLIGLVFFCYRRCCFGSKRFPHCQESVLYNFL